MPLWFSYDSLPNLLGAYQSSSSKVVATSLYAFEDLAIGTAEALRSVVMGISYAAVAQTIDSITCAGVTATVIASADSGNRFVYLAHAVVPSGTTASFTVSLSGAISNMAIGVWSINNAVRSLTTEASAITTTGVAISTTMSVNSFFGGFMVGFAVTGGLLGAPTSTWTGPLPEDYEIVYAGSFEMNTGASLNSSIATTVTSTVTFGSNSGAVCGCFGSFQP